MNYIDIIESIKNKSQLYPLVWISYMNINYEYKRIEAMDNAYNLVFSQYSGTFYKTIFSLINLFIIIKQQLYIFILERMIIFILQISGRFI